MYSPGLVHSRLVGTRPVFSLKVPFSCQDYRNVHVKSTVFANELPKPFTVKSTDSFL